MTEEKLENENPYLLLGFFEFAILATLFVVFFPWSLLFLLIVYGMDITKLFVAALLHDLIKTIMAILAVVIPIALLIIFLVASSI